MPQLLAPPPPLTGLGLEMGLLITIGQKKKPVDEPAKTKAADRPIRKNFMSS